MKIAIITLPLHVNYGGLLQAYALQTVLTRMGHQVTVIDKSRYYVAPWKAPLLYAKRAVEKYVLHHREHVLEERFLKRTYPVVGRYTDHFIQRNICRRPVNTMHDIRRGQYDAFVVGSDQIWRPHFFPHIEEAFLSFARGWDVKRVAYAPSFGTDTWEYSAAQTARCARLLKDFDAVSVREQSGVALCRDHLGASARHVPDPTMLLPASDYSAIIDDYDHWRQAATSSGNGASAPDDDNAGARLDMQGRLMTYILDEGEGKNQLIAAVERHLHTKAFAFNARPYAGRGSMEDHVKRPVEEWLRAFRDARFVVTDSFHGCVFAILFRRPFIVYVNHKRGAARIESLLAAFGLQSRMATDASQINFSPIPYDDVHARLSRMKAKAVSVLSALGG